AFSPDLPSRRKNEPGILPAAYMRSSTSTVSGRKSTSRSPPIVAVLRTIVSPLRTTTAPLARFASLPVSTEIVLSPTSAETRVTSNMLIRFFTSGHPDGGHSFSDRTLVLFNAKSTARGAAGKTGAAGDEEGAGCGGTGWRVRRVGKVALQGVRGTAESPGR